MGKTVYRIRDWRARYEVNAKGGEAGEGDTLRLRPLEFVRWQVRGRDIGIGLRRVNKLAGEEFAPAVFGVFAKMVEIAAQENRERRGYVLTSDGEPMTAGDIAEATEWSEGVIARALTILLHERVEWLEEVDFPEFREVPEIPAPYITKPNRTEQKRREGDARERAALPAFAALEEFPELKAAYPSLRKRMAEVHAHTPLTEVGSQMDLLDQKALAACCSEDRFEPAEVIATIEWCLRGETKDALFWQSKVHTLRGLRHRKAKGEPTRFTRMFEDRTAEQKVKRIRNGRQPAPVDDAKRALEERMRKRFGCYQEGLSEADHERMFGRAVASATVRGDA